MNEDRIRELLREMRDEPVPAGSLLRIQAGASERIAASSRRGTVWRVALALAAGVVFAVLLLRPPKPQSVPESIALAPAGRPPEPELAPAAAKPAPAKPAVRRVRKPPSPDGGAIIRIETPDPDVVILLIGEE